MYMKCTKCGQNATFKVKIKKSAKETTTHMCGSCASKIPDEHTLYPL